MNHCRRCDCDFEQPGTCNCFAPIRLYPQPWIVPTIYPIPYSPPYPYYPPFSPPLPYITVTWGGTGTGEQQPNMVLFGNDIRQGCVTTIPVVSNTVDSTTFADVPFTYTTAKAITAGQTNS